MQQALLLGREVVVSALEVYCRQRQRLLHLLPYHITDAVRRTLVGDPALIAVDQRDDWWRCHGALVGQPCDGMPPELARGRIAELAAEPLLNYLIAITRAEGEVDFADEQTSLIDVYDDLVGQVYRRTHARRAGDADGASHALPVARQVTEAEFRRFLQTIAVAAWHGDGRLATERQIRARLDERFLGKVDALTAGAKDGISRLVAAFYFRPHRGDHGDAAFEFTHQSFAEYLLAQQLVRFLQRMRRERARHLEDAEYEGGWSARRCLSEWLRLFGPAAIEPHVFDFVCDALRREAQKDAARVDGDAARMGTYQATLGDLISRVLVDDFPSDGLPAASHLGTALAYSRNAGEALLVLASGCARITEQHTPVRWPDRMAFGTWLRRLQGQSDVGWPMVHRHLVWLPLRALALSSIDLRKADLFGADLRGADLFGADLRGAHLFGADLRGAHLEGAHLEGAHLRGAHLRGAHLEGAHLRGAHLEGAHLEGAFCDSQTRFPAGFEPAEVGMRVVDSSV